MEIVAKVGEDPIVQEFVCKFEVPAIEFENLMMGKYKDEPGRITDYVNSAIYDEVVKSIDRHGLLIQH